MTAVVGRALGWLFPWGRGSVSDTAAEVATKGQKQDCGSQSRKGWASYLWGGWRRQSDQSSPVEEFWEAPERVQPLEIEDLCAGKQDSAVKSEKASRWWSRCVPTSFFLWPKTTTTTTTSQKNHDGQSRVAWDNDDEYRTPPPSPTPPSRLTSPFRFFAHSWRVDILPEHYDICFNFLRHLFDLVVVGFLWTVSPPAKLILEVLGVNGALRLWFHGMAMFFVSTVGMAGLLWLIQEYLPQFALIYGIIQAMVISVSVRQSVIVDVGEDGMDEDKKEMDGVMDDKKLCEKYIPAEDKLKTS